MADTHVYIDALNLYYGAVKKTPYKWLDLEAFARALVPKDNIKLIRYFTAPVKQRFPGDRAHERQNAYLRALATNPLIEIHKGHFTVRDKWRALSERSNHPRDLFRPVIRPIPLLQLMLASARRRQTEPATVARVIVPEEKGSDVNLATFLLYDAYVGVSSKAVVVSNDSDLAEAVRLTVQKGVQVGLVNPHHAPTSGKLLKVASFEIKLRPKVLPRCQLPNPITNSKGSQIHKPVTW
jgi:uncharacterized LabA/DUF88 family protein